MKSFIACQSNRVRARAAVSLQSSAKKRKSSRERLETNDYLLKTCCWSQNGVNVGRMKITSKPMSGTPEMKIAVERLAGVGCRATFVNSQTVVENVFGEEFSRLVEVYRLEGHARARNAFIWDAGNGATRRRPVYRVVLGVPPIISAEKAVASWTRGFERDLVNED
jgi:hypothetical protein